MWRPNLLYWAERSKSEFKLKLYRLCCHGRAGGEESEDKLLFSPRGRSLILLRLQQRSGRKVPPQRKVPGLLEASSPVIKCWPFALVAPTFLSAQWKIQTWRNTAGYQSGCPVSDCFDQGDSRHDIKELKKFVQIMGPMERIFRQLNSELESTIHLCKPFKVDNLFWVVYISIYLLQDMLESLKPRVEDCFGAAGSLQVPVWFPHQQRRSGLPTTVLACHLLVSCLPGRSLYCWDRGGKKVCKE